MDERHKTRTEEDEVAGSEDASLLSVTCLMNDSLIEKPVKKTVKHTLGKIVWPYWFRPDQISRPEVTERNKTHSRDAQTGGRLAV